MTFLPVIIVSGGFVDIFLTVSLLKWLEEDETEEAEDNKCFKRSTEGTLLDNSIDINDDDKSSLSSAVVIFVDTNCSYRSSREYNQTSFIPSKIMAKNPIPASNSIIDHFTW